MANMVLGTYTFIKNPSEMSVITPVRDSSGVKTYSSSAFFSWGATVAGQTISMRFNFISITQYASFLSLLEADASVVFNPNDGTGYTYNVEITNLQGDYFVKLDTGVRQNVIVDLFILSKVV
jgi:hypothetical protein